MKGRILFTFLMFLFVSKGFSQITLTQDPTTCTDVNTTLHASFYGDNPLDAGIVEDDVYPTVPNPIGFTFKFYGVNYTSCLIGPNGTVCFDVSLAGAADDWQILGPLAGNATVFNSICGPWCDMDILFGGSITYSTDGVAPNRKFVVNYCTTHMYSCTTQYTTSQIVMYEGSNIVDVFVAHKDICAGWNGGYAIIGVQNATGSASTAAPGRDFPNVYTCLDEAWRFTPNAAGSAYAVTPIEFSPVPYASSSVYWYDSTTNTYLGSGLSITVPAASGHTIRAAALGCGDTSFSSFILSTPSMAATLTSQNPSVCGYSDGSITVTMPNASTAYTLNYIANGTPVGPIPVTSTAASTVLITGLPAGTYSNITLSVGGCSTPPLSAVLVNPPPPVVTVDSPIISSCVGNHTQMHAYATPTGIPYNYTWTPSGDLNNGTIWDPIVTPTTGATVVYTVSVNPGTDPTCAGTANVTVQILPSTVSVHPHDTSVCRGAVVQIVGTSAAGAVFQWLPTAGIALSTSLSPLITADTSATYVIHATFPFCPSATDTVRLDVQPVPTVYAGGNRMLCQFDSLHINANVIPQWYSNYSYFWTPSANLDHNNTQTVVFNGQATVKEYVTVTTPAGCKATDSVLITVNPGNFVESIPNKDFCPHDSFQVAPLASTGATYRWFPAFCVSDSNSSAPWIRPVATQVYTIIATSDAGCKDTLTFKAIVHPAGVLFLGDSVTLHPGETYQISPQTNCVSFSWFPPQGLNDPFASNPLANPEVSTNYVVTGVTEHGCIARDSISIYVDDESIVAMPNAFHPGTTGNNILYKAILKGEATLNYFRIYNRWGNLVFETQDISKGWDGSYKGKSQEVGVYVYDIQAITSKGTVVNKQGNITLIR